MTSTVGDYTREADIPLTIDVGIDAPSFSEANLSLSCQGGMGMMDELVVLDGSAGTFSTTIRALSDGKFSLSYISGVGALPVNVFSFSRGQNSITPFTL